jgi:hypothetical protein
VSYRQDAEHRNADLRRHELRTALRRHLREAGGSHSGRPP